MKHWIPMGKINGQPTRIILNMYNQWKSWADEQKADFTKEGHNLPIFRPQSILRPRIQLLKKRLCQHKEGLWNAIAKVYSSVNFPSFPQETITVNNTLEIEDNQIFWGLLYTESKLTLKPGICASYFWICRPCGSRDVASQPESLLPRDTKPHWT